MKYMKHQYLLYLSLATLYGFCTSYAIPENSTPTSFEKLIKNSTAFAQTTPFPTKANLISSVAEKENSRQIIITDQANNTYPLIDERVTTLIDHFLQHKKIYGSSIEKKLYKTMRRTEFIDRLLTCRPLMFMGASDSYMLRNGQKGTGGFDMIGTDNEKAPFVLTEYLSYDEMQIAALIGVSVPTYFINTGDRTNQAKKAPAGTYQETGIYVGLVGARFERPGLMEYQHMVVTKEQNTIENGYGKHPHKNSAHARLLAAWSRFYGHTLYDYASATKDTSGRFLRLTDNSLLDTTLYKERIKLVLKPFFADANNRGKKAGRSVYCHVVGLGLGVWKITTDQTKLFLEACAELLRSHHYKHISDINFSYFGNEPALHVGGIKDSQQFTQARNSITIHFSKRNPADTLTGIDKDKLLVAMYAWDGNAYPGNEYWAGSLTASGDPAAACCSTIAELQNPLINPNVCAQKLTIYR